MNGEWGSSPGHLRGAMRTSGPARPIPSRPAKPAPWLSSTRASFWADHRAGALRRPRRGYRRQQLSRSLKRPTSKRCTTSPPRINRNSSANGAARYCNQGRQIDYGPDRPLLPPQRCHEVALPHRDTLAPRPRAMPGCLALVRRGHGDSGRRRGSHDSRGDRLPIRRPCVNHTLGDPSGCQFPLSISGPALVQRASP